MGGKDYHKGETIMDFIMISLLAFNAFISGAFIYKYKRYPLSYMALDMMVVLAVVLHFGQIGA